MDSLSNHARLSWAAFQPKGPVTIHTHLLMRSSTTGHSLAALFSLIALAMLGGCAAQQITAVPSPTVAAQPTALPASTATETRLGDLSQKPPSPTSTLLFPSPTLAPKPTATTFLTFSIDPPAVMVAAGGATIIEGGPTNWRDSTPPSRPNWQVSGVVDGLPPGARAERLHALMPGVQSFGIATSCQTPPGTYTLTLHTTGPGVSQSAQTRLTVGTPVRDSPMGTFTTTREIDLNFGGPTSRESAVSAPVTFCDTMPPRRLRITVQSALSKAGTPLPHLPAYRLFRALTPGAEDGIEHGLYWNALIVPQANEDQQEWELSGGPYIIVFGEYLWSTDERDEELIGQVSYTLETVQ